MLKKDKDYVAGIADLISSVNDSGYDRVPVIADCHGCYDKLMGVLDKVKVKDSDLLIMTGDFIDRGKDVDKVLKWIMENKDKKNLIFLKGNHEAFMLSAFYETDDKEAELAWRINGGNTTIEALRRIDAEDKLAVENILNFIESLPFYHKMTIDSRNYIFVHGGLKPRVPLE